MQPESLPNIHEFLTHATALGNSSVLLAVTLLCSIWLASSSYLHAAASLWIAFIVTALLTMAAKLLLLGCIEDTVFGMRSPSGHAALSLATYGMLGLLFAQTIQGVLRALLHIILIFLIITIAFSRFYLKYHSAAEVLIGLVFGFIGLITAGIYFFNWKRELLRFNVMPMLLVLVGTAYILRGVDIPAEIWLKKASAELKNYIDYCISQESHAGSTSRDNSSS